MNRMSFMLGMPIGVLAVLLIVFTLAMGCCADGYYGPTDTADMKPVSGVLVIRNATGGRVFQSQTNFQRLEDEGAQVKVLGNCGSSCGLLLTHKNICYAPDARFVFHGASVPSMSVAIENALPQRIGEWSRSNDAMGSPDRLVSISGAEIARLDNTDRTCL